MTVALVLFNSFHTQELRTVDNIGIMLMNLKKCMRIMAK